MNLSHLEDQAAIRSVIARYSDAVTQRDFDVVASLWSNSGTWVLTKPYNRTVTGRAAIVTFLRTLLGDMSFFVQMAHNGVIEVDGDTARARWTFHEIGESTGSGAGHQNVGFYDDVMQREAEGWLFVSRTYHWIYLDESNLAGKVIRRD